MRRRLGPPTNFSGHVFPPDRRAVELGDREEECHRQAQQRQPFPGQHSELECSVTGRSTTSVSFDGQAASGQSALFTGYRWENRFRPFRHNHWINPVLYAEYAGLDGADKTLVEVVGAQWLRSGLSETVFGLFSLSAQ